MGQDLQFCRIRRNVVYLLPRKAHCDPAGEQDGDIEKDRLVGRSLFHYWDYIIVRPPCPWKRIPLTDLAFSLVALQAGGYTHPWKSAYVLAQLIIGIMLLIAFCIWEWKGAKLPMVPRELFQGQHTIGVTFLLLFVAGMNFYSLINCK